MKFWDREKEKKWLKHYLLTEPNAILFVYGPKSSGKTTLLMKVVEELPKDNFIYYWFDLRERLISNYKDVVDVFFVDEEAAKVMRETSKELEMGISSFFKISLKDKKMIEERRIDPFKYMADMMREDKAKGLTPVIVFDELQKLKDIYLNGGSQRPLIKELFNFFVRLTKVLHLSHVIVMTSDTFFIEQVYTDSTLVNTSRFYLVDYFDDETARDILISEGLNEKDALYAVEHTGGVPWMMEEILESEEPMAEIERLYRDVLGLMKNLLGELYEKGMNEEALKVITKVLDGVVDISGGDRKIVKILAEYEIFFYDPVNSEVRFQTRMHERAAKELLRVK